MGELGEIPLLREISQRMRGYLMSLVLARLILKRKINQKEKPECESYCSRETRNQPNCGREGNVLKWNPSIV